MAAFRDNDKTSARGPRSAFLGAVLLTLWLPGVSAAAEAPANAPSKGLEIPAAEVIRGRLPTADAAFREMVVSHPFESADPRVRGGVDIIQWITDDLKMTVQGKHPDLKGVALKDVKKVYQFYGFGSDKLMTAIVDALKNSELGQIEIVTDLNLALDGAFRKGEEFNSNWAAGTIKDSEPGRALKKLLDAGCGFGGKSRCQIRGGQPLYNTAQGAGEESARVPIFHHKDMFTVVMERDKSGKITGERCVNMKTGTANMNETAPRYNRFFDVVDPDLNQAAYEHHLRVIANSDNGGRIFEIESKPPLQVVYRDGTSIQFASTDGKFELNQQIVADWKKWAAAPEQYKLQRIWGSHFALTDADMIRAQGEVMKAQPASTAFWINDQGFVTEWGVPGPMAGITASRPMGGPVHAYPHDVRFNAEGKPRIQSFVYIRSADNGITETDRNGPPNGRHLWHDKTTVSLFDNSASQDATETLKAAQYRVSTLSYNGSHNFHNAESQFTMHLNRDSWVARGIVDSIEKVVRNEPKFAIPLYKGIPQVNLAILTGHRDVEVSAPDVDALLKAVRKNDTAEMEKLLDAISARPTTISKKVSGERLHASLGDLQSFLKWLSATPGGADKISNISYNDLNSLLEILHDKEMNSANVSGLLADILWGLGDAKDSEARKASVAKLLPQAWEAIGIQKPFEAPVQKTEIGSLHSSPGEAKPPATRPNTAPLEISLFDWDDTIANLDTKIKLYKTRKDGKPGTTSKGVTTREFAEIRDRLGKADGGDWAGYQLSDDSFSNFRDPNFLKDVQEAFTADPAKAKGPEFGKFKSQLQRVVDLRNAAVKGKSAPLLRVGILSARGHSRQATLEAIQWLLDNGHLKVTGLNPPIQASSLIKAEDIFMMSNPESNPKALSQEAAKAWALEQRAATAERFYKANPVRGRPTLWFGDDDAGNVQKVRDVIASDIQSRFPDVDVYVKRVASDSRQQQLYFVKSDGSFEEINRKLNQTLVADAAGAPALTAADSAAPLRGCEASFSRLPLRTPAGVGSPR